MKKLFTYSILFSISLLFLGCKEANLSKELGLKKDTTPSESCQVDQRLSALMKKDEDSLNRYLNLAGLFYQKQNYVESNRYFDKAISKYRFYENKGVISASRTLNYIIASFLNDTFLDYEGDGYEKVMMHNYKAINYLMLNDKEKARVEIRNSYKKQMEEKQKFAKEIAEYKKKDKEQLETEKRLPRKKRRYRRSKESIYKKLKPLFEGVNSKHMPYQNPFAYYVSALVYEENGEFDDAYIDIKKAYDFYPDSKILKEKLLYYAKKAYGEDSDEYKKALSLTKDIFNDKPRAELFINISNSPKKEQMKVPIYMGGAMQFVSFPTFKLSQTPIDHVVVKDSNGSVVATSSLLTDVDAIVINIFKERVPGIILRQVINVGSKTVASETISNKIDNGNVLVSAAVGLGMSLVNAVTSKADTRTWNTLPSSIHALSFNIDKAKKYTLYVIDKNGQVVSKEPLVFKKNKDLKNSYLIVTIKGQQICK